MRQANLVGETNTAGIGPDTQTVSTFNALYSADEVTTLLENGASNVDWFATHNWIQPDTVGAADDPNGTGYGDYGVLSAGTDSCGPNALGQTSYWPAASTPPAPAWSARPAAVEPDGTLIALIENQNPTTTHQATIDYPGYRGPSPSPPSTPTARTTPRSTAPSARPTASPSPRTP